MESGQGYDSRKEVKAGSETVTFWLDAIAQSDKEERDWREEAGNVISVYRGDKSNDASYMQDMDFNILHANVETILPSVYNSSPAPDIRRRFGEKDPVAKVVSQILERALSYSQDQYDYDGMMYSVLFDASVPGRGVARVRYVPYENEGGGGIEYEEVRCEYVHWRRFRRGKADAWGDVPWIAFEHFLNKDELERIADKETINSLSFDYSIKEGQEREAVDDTPDVYKRARVWEIWDKETKQVFFIAPCHPEKPLAVQDDPLQLKDFFPIPKPVMPVHTPGNLTPVCPYSIYRKLAEELNAITRRIRTIVAQIRVRGAYAINQNDLDRLMMADDGELVGLEGPEIIAQYGLDKLISWWPIEPQVKALQQLYQQREQLKQTIYEVTGISDIVRGNTKATETATAQQIKTQWGSLRIQKLQNEVQRFARDLYRMKAELMASHFDMQTLTQVSGIRLLPGAQKQQMQMMAQSGQQMPEAMQKAMGEPAIEEVEQVIRDDLIRSYRIDVESDSTIRSDMTKNIQHMQEFLQGTAQYLSSVGPLIQMQLVPPQPLVEIYTSFARQYKLGKQAEDALDQLSEEAAKPQQPKPDPEQEKAKMQMQMEQQKMQLQQQSDQAKMQMQQQSDQARLQMENQKAENDATLAREKMENDIALKREEMGAKIQIEREKAANDYELAVMKANAELEIKRDMAHQQAAINADSAAAKSAIAAKQASDNAKRQKAKAAN